MDGHQPSTSSPQTWVAVGLLIEHGNVSSINALDLLGAYSFGQDTTLDDTADQLTTKRLLPNAVLAVYRTLRRFDGRSRPHQQDREP